MAQAVLITKGTNAEQAQGLAEGLGHTIHADLEGFLLTPQELADILNANLQHITKPLAGIDIKVDFHDDQEPIEIQLHATEQASRVLQAYLNGVDQSNQLLHWICQQDRLTIERWCYPGGKCDVSVWTSLDDENTPSGTGESTYEALEKAQAHQLKLITEG